MSQELIMVVDDEQNILELVRYNLVRRGYRVLLAETGEAALVVGANDLPDLILLDLMLPGIDGLDVCRYLKADPRTQHIPIVLVTARGQEEDIALGMEMGADDYITKPFSPKVLISRIRAALRRRDNTREEFESILRLGTLVINPIRQEVIVEGGVAELSETQFQLLLLLARSPEKVFSRRDILSAVFADTTKWAEKDVDTMIEDLCESLGPCGSYIVPVRNAGYQMNHY
ncbi:MAG: response regulator [Phycisphaerae bacterium]|nr:response regulator [Phycisphaerae bacterium]